MIDSFLLQGLNTSVLVLFWVVIDAEFLAWVLIFRLTFKKTPCVFLLWQLGSPQSELDEVE